jgi:uncharacterized protein (DUF433 family)
MPIQCTVCLLYCALEFVMTLAPESHISLNKRGTLVIDGTTTPVIMIVKDKISGLSPEQIRAAYPYLSLSQIHAALAYYYDHQSDLDTQIAQETQRAVALRNRATAAGSQPTRQQLKRRLKTRGKRA